MSMQNNSLQDNEILLLPFVEVDGMLEGAASVSVNGEVFTGKTRIALDATADEKIEAQTGLACYMARKIWKDV